MRCQWLWDKTVSFLWAFGGYIIGQFLAEQFLYLLRRLIFGPVPRLSDTDDFNSPPIRTLEEAYAILGLLPEAPRREVQMAFLKAHPDKGSQLTPEQWQMKAKAFRLIKKTRQQQGIW